jgi:hypothetical protein
MSDLLDPLRQRHQDNLDQLKRREVDETFLDEIHALIIDLQEAGAVTANPAQRGQLRALMHFWGNMVYDHTGTYPDTTLQPLDSAHAPPPEQPPRRPSPPLIWALSGGAAAIIIAAGLVAIGWMSYARTGPTPTPTPTPAPAVFLSHIAMGTQVGQDATLETGTDTFCMDTPQIVAEIAMAGIEPETSWHWEVQREGEILDTLPAAPWGHEATHTIRVLTGDSGSVEPCQYTLLLHAGDRVVGAHTFQVLDTAPHVSNPRVADVPQSPQGTSGGPDESTFESGLRVLYLDHEYEGFCPQVVLSYALYHEEAPVQEIVETWRGTPQGQAQVSFQAPGDLPFPPGDYEVAVTIAGEEQARARFTIAEETAEAPAPETPPAFGNLTIAAGVQPDGTPVLPAPDSQFDWNTKLVYTIFDYVGMVDGLKWSATWMRNGEEVAREEHFWDIEAYAPSGTRWVTYHDERGVPLPGGNYSVTLYVENALQGTAEFNVLYYVPPEPTPQEG